MRITACVMGIKDWGWRQGLGSYVIGFGADVRMANTELARNVTRHLRVWPGSRFGGDMKRFLTVLAKCVWALSLFCDGEMVFYYVYRVA